MAGGLPTVSVHLDDGTGTFPHDVTAKVRMVEGITITRGRGDEQANVQPSTCILTFDNTDGRFTLGSTVIASPSPITVNRMIRIRYVIGATTYNRFVGFVQEWPVVWPRGGQEFSTVTITATDILASAARLPLRTQLADVMIQDGAAVLFPLMESTGPNQNTGRPEPVAYNIGPTTTSPLLLDTTKIGGNFPAPTFNDREVPNSNGSVVTWAPSNSGLNPASFYGVPTAPFAMDTSYSIEFAFAVTSVAGQYSCELLRMFDSSGDYGLSIAILDPDWLGANRGFEATLQAGTGFTEGTDVATANSAGFRTFQDDVVHWLTAVVTNSGKTLTIYIDGVLLQSASMTASLAGKVFASWRLSNLSIKTNSSIGYFGLYPGVALSAAQAAEHAGIARNPVYAQRSDEAMTRFASYLNATVNAPLQGAQSVPIFDTRGDSAASAIDKIASAEQGIAFVDGSGVIQFLSRLDRVVAAEGSPDATVTNDDLNASATFAVDMQQVVNRATIARTGGVPQTAENAASIAAYRVYPYSADLALTDDSQAGSIAAWLVYLKNAPAGRLAGASFDMLTLEQATQQALAACDISSWLRITGLPSQTPGGAQAELWIEGTTEVISANAWGLAVNTSPNNLQPATTPLWRLDSGTYPLGTNTRLYI